MHPKISDLRAITGYRTWMEMFPYVRRSKVFGGVPYSYANAAFNRQRQKTYWAQNNRCYSHYFLNFSVSGSVSSM